MDERNIPEAKSLCPLSCEIPNRVNTGNHDAVPAWEFNAGKHGSYLSPRNSGEVIKRRLAEIFFAETDKGDYFIGRLDSSIPHSKIKPLLNAPADYSDLLDQDEFPGAFATMAGFSRDSGRGQDGKDDDLRQSAISRAGKTVLRWAIALPTAVLPVAPPR